MFVNRHEPQETHSPECSQIRLPWRGARRFFLPEPAYSIRIGLAAIDPESAPQALFFRLHRILQKFDKTMKLLYAISLTITLMHAAAVNQNKAICGLRPYGEVRWDGVGC
jgi:hypothetical protein